METLRCPEYSRSALVVEGVETVAGVRPAPDGLTRSSLLFAAALPWYAVVSGVFALYFYILLLVPMAGRVLDGAFEKIATDILFALSLLAALPLGLLLLVVMPLCLMRATFRCPPGGIAGRLSRIGCIVSMILAALYTTLIVVGLFIDLAQSGGGILWWPGQAHVVVLMCGLAATWRSWRWLSRTTDYSHKR